MINMKNNGCHHPVERVYVTKGDNLYNGDGVLADKAVGVMMDNKIHWLDAGYDTVESLNYLLNPLFISVDKDCRGTPIWGTFKPNDSSMCAILNKKLTRINKHPDDVFSSGYYIKKSVRTKDGKLFFKIDELRQLIKDKMQT